jgi:anti-sigma-K factor RskA
VPVTRARSSADIRREIEAAERRLSELVSRWQSSGMSADMAVDSSSREALDAIEEILRQQRGAVDRLHQLWIEYAQAIGQHAPQ